MDARGLNRVLYVEDEPDIAFVLSAALEQLHGITVATSADAESTLQLVPSFRPDLILLDMMLPKTDGATLLRMLRDVPETAHTPVVFVTAKVQANEMEHYEKLGAIGVIAKPFDPLHIGAVLLGMWDRAQARESHG
jgi:CheY-like chemotaxis protein